MQDAMLGCNLMDFISIMDFRFKEMAVAVGVKVR